jgi:hypothetical protein
MDDSCDCVHRYGGYKYQPHIGMILIETLIPIIFHESDSQFPASDKSTRRKEK